VSESRFHQIREEFLQKSLPLLEPAKVGRKPKDREEDEEVERLRAENEELRIELENEKIRTEVAGIIPETPQKKSSRKKRKRKRKRKGIPPPTPRRLGPEEKA
jgi:hypothetical protein